MCVCTVTRATHLPAIFRHADRSYVIAAAHSATVRFTKRARALNEKDFFFMALKLACLFFFVPRKEEKITFRITLLFRIVEYYAFNLRKRFTFLADTF